MAQIFQIPLEFGFRTVKVKWSVASAQVTGWRKRDDGTIDTDNLTAETFHHGSTGTVKIALQDLPSDEWERCVETIGDEDSDDLVRTICSGWQPQFLWPSVPDRSYWWEKSEFRKLSSADAWQMRDEFLRMLPDNDGAIAFLDEWGHWSGGWVYLKRILGLQSQVRKALSSSPDQWFASSVPSHLNLWKRDPEYPFFAVRTCHCETAICMTVTIDLLRRAKFRICARKDCRVPFEVKSKHERKYCSWYCAHLESVRRNRKQNRMKNQARGTRK
jgi:hypothetical protein